VKPCADRDWRAAILQAIDESQFFSTLIEDAGWRGDNKDLKDHLVDVVITALRPLLEKASYGLDDTGLSANGEIADQINNLLETKR